MVDDTHDIPLSLSISRELILSDLIFLKYLHGVKRLLFDLLNKVNLTKGTCSKELMSSEGVSANIVLLDRDSAALGACVVAEVMVFLCLRFFIHLVLFFKTNSLFILIPSLISLTPLLSLPLLRYLPKQELNLILLKTYSVNELLVLLFFDVF